jgi:hypothetical protein
MDLNSFDTAATKRTPDQQKLFAEEYVSSKLFSRGGGFKASWILWSYNRGLSINEGGIIG